MDVESLCEEVNLMSSLQQENIVTYYSYAVVEEHLIIVSEFVSGGSLFKLVEDFGALPVGIVQRCAADILRGLSYLHSQNVVHGDVKPHNVVITTDGVCKLTDFGAAQAMQESIADIFQLRGTSGYMSPEVARGKRLSAASDVWSFGITVLELLSGKLQWEESPVETDAAAAGLFSEAPLIASGPTHPLNLSQARLLQALQKQTVRIRVPHNVDPVAIDLVRSCLRYDPTQRPRATDLLGHRFFA
jgi:serine/threonine protein kinase